MSDVMTGARGVPKSDPIGAGRGLGVPGDRNRWDTTVRVARTLAFGGQRGTKVRNIDAGQGCDPENDLCEQLFDVRDLGTSRLKRTLGVPKSDTFHAVIPSRGYQNPNP
jgi:hypothetical protein